MLSADNRLVYKTLRCITKLTSLATIACHLLTRLYLSPALLWKEHFDSLAHIIFAAVELGQLLRGS